MDLRRLRHVVLLAKHASYLRASEEANLSPSALSRSIQSFEDECGLKLFDRRRGGVYATTIGEMVVRAAKPLLTGAENLQKELKSIKAEKIGHVGFGMGPLPASLILKELFVGATTSRRRISMHVSVEPPEVLLKHLADCAIEFVICSRGVVPRNEDFEIRTIGGYRVSLLARSGHPLVGRERVTNEDLSGFPLLGAGLQRWTANIFEYLGIEELIPDIACDNYHVLMETVLETDAVCLCSSSIIDRIRPASDLVELHYQQGRIGEREELVVVTLADRTLPPAAARVLAMIQQLID
jgi:DNA-binding transcriptional LysR family regulator